MYYWLLYNIFLYICILRRVVIYIWNEIEFSVEENSHSRICTFKVNIRIKYSCASGKMEFVDAVTPEISNAHSDGRCLDSI